MSRDQWSEHETRCRNYLKKGRAVLKPGSYDTRYRCSTQGEDYRRTGPWIEGFHRKCFLRGDRLRWSFPTPTERTGLLLFPQKHFRGQPVEGEIRDRIQRKYRE